MVAEKATDDYSRYILACELKRDMRADSLVDMIQQAVDITGMSEVPVKDRTSPSAQPPKVRANTTPSSVGTMCFTARPVRQPTSLVGLANENLHLSWTGKLVELVSKGCPVKT